MTVERLRLEVDEDVAGSRLDVFLARAGGMSRADAAAAVRAGTVTVDGLVRAKSHRVSRGEVVEASIAVIDAPTVPAGAVDVVLEDDHLLVVDKASGVVVHPASGTRGGTLVDALRAAGKPLAQAAGVDRPGIVHRLDRDVSGLLVVAKTDDAYTGLVRAMADRQIERTYLAVVSGLPEADRGTIDAPVARDPKHRTRMATRPEGKTAVTHFRVAERFAETALLEVRLETGRTHQIRTHLQAIGHPIVGDAAYGMDRGLAARLGLSRPFLHAHRLRFAHPVTGETVEAVSELPGDLASALRELRG